MSASAPDLRDELFNLPDIPLPSADGKFQSPADGAKWMLGRFGIPQIPLSGPTDTRFNNPGKNPAINGTGWPDKVCTTPEMIDAAAKKYPGCNFGSVAKQELGGHFVLEVDSSEVREIYRKETGHDFTASLLVISGEGRGHRWYLHDKNSSGLVNIGQEDSAGFSLRVHNELTVSPGSWHVRGTQYRVDMNYCAVPTPASAEEIAWFKSKKSSKQIKKAETTANGERIKIKHGAMYSALISEAGRLWNRGYSEDIIETALCNFAEQNCEPPIDLSKVRSYARGANWKQGEPGKEFVYSGLDSMPEVVEDVKLPPFPKFSGLLADLATAIFPDIPYEFKVSALLVHWGLMRSGKDNLDSDPHLQPRFYVCLLAKPGVGKTASINEARNFAKMWGSSYVNQSSMDSGPALVDKFSKVHGQNILKTVGVENAQIEPARILLDPDELQDLLEKAKVTLQGRNSLVTELLKLFEGNITGNTSKKTGDLQVNDAHLAVLAGATIANYERMWTGTGSGSSGLQSRFVPIGTVNGKMPITKAPSDAKALAELIPKLIELAKSPGITVSLDKDARVLLESWWGTNREKDSETRVDDMVKRLLIVLGVTANQPVIGIDLMKEAIAFGDYVIQAREKYNPQDSFTMVQAMEQIIERVCVKQEKSMSENDIRRFAHPNNKPGGYGVFIQAMRNLKQAGVLKPDGLTAQNTAKFKFVGDVHGN